MASNPEPALHVPSTRGVTVAVHDLGGDGAPLLIAHANGFCGGTYGPLAQVLAPHRHVWALDFRGQGQSTPPEDLDFDWDGLADDVLAVVTPSAVAPSTWSAIRWAVPASCGPRCARPGPSVAPTSTSRSCCPSASVTSRPAAT